MIVNTLKMCSGDVGPEQSLVLFFLKKRDFENNKYWSRQQKCL